MLTKKQQAELVEKYTAKHLQELKAIGYKENSLTPLIGLEDLAHKISEDGCNGVISDTDFDTNMAEISIAVKKLFKKDINQYGFFINTDPRGYALKLQEINSTNREKLVLNYQDMGGYQILCPQFSY